MSSKLMRTRSNAGRRICPIRTPMFLGAAIITTTNWHHASGCNTGFFMKAWLLSLHDRKNSKWTYACGPCRERVRRHLTLAVGHAGAAWRRVRLGACTTGHMNDGGNPGGEEEAKAQGGGGRQSGRVLCTYGEYQTSVEEHDDIDED